MWSGVVKTLYVYFVCFTVLVQLQQFISVLVLCLMQCAHPDGTGMLFGILLPG